MQTRSVSLVLCAAIMSGTLLTACNKPPETAGMSSTATTEVSDIELTRRVKTALLTEESVKSFDITVVTAKGDVRLTGILDTQEQIDTAHKLVLAVEGVHSLHDELTLKK